jgi:hypothetical protein
MYSRNKKKGQGGNYAHGMRDEGKTNQKLKNL